MTTERLTRIVLLVLVGAIVYMVGSYLLNTPGPTDAQINCVRMLREQQGFWGAQMTCSTLPR